VVLTVRPITSYKGLILAGKSADIAGLAGCGIRPDIPGHGGHAMAGKIFTLIPFHVREAMSIADAAKTAGKSERTLRDWVAKHGIGRHVAGGTVMVSKVALIALLEGDDDALISYRDHGVRASYQRVARIFERLDLGDVLSLPEFRV
jgi:hypothetical protein